MEVIEVSLFSFSAAFFLLAMWNFYWALQGIRSDKRFVANFIGPLVFVLPGYFDREAVGYRNKFVAYLVVSIVLSALLLVMSGELRF